MEYLQYDESKDGNEEDKEVLNLVISGIPSILNNVYATNDMNIVLNLVISGIPSILQANKTWKKSQS